MSEVINLRQARKRRRRAEKEGHAAANRAIHGTPSGELATQRLIQKIDRIRLEAHRRDRPGGPDQDS